MRVEPASKSIKHTKKETPKAGRAVARNPQDSSNKYLVKGFSALFGSL